MKGRRRCPDAQGTTHPHSVAHQPRALPLWIAILAACLAVYRVMAALRERRGTSLDLAVRLLPPD